MTTTLYNFFFQVVGDITNLENKVPAWNWNINQSKLLLDFYKELRPKVGSSEIKTLKKLWTTIAVKLNTILGTNISPHNCENRWRVLEGGYKKFIDGKNTTGNGRTYFEFEEEMNQIFQGKKNVKPVILLSNTTVMQPYEEEINNRDINNMEMSPTKEIPTTSKSGISKTISRKSGKRNNPVINRNKILTEIREDKKKFYEEKLVMEKEKLELEKKKIAALEQKNLLLQARNEILRTKGSNNCDCV
ncbi:hypothetical protein ABEB36_009623 [Hypothenemus hampei]|uniref:Myb/SANT-like DNA-binding domain-containing protein n=1 Tax=Hypothenemus hampei TaxID=57062 RepID=A0ABD1EGX9_HYPHA